MKYTEKKTKPGNLPTATLLAKGRARTFWALSAVYSTPSCSAASQHRLPGRHCPVVPGKETRKGQDGSSQPARPSHPTSCHLGRRVADKHLT